jgi:hypothetical protein
MKKDFPFVIVGSRSYRLYPRGKGKDSPLCLRIQHHGTQNVFSTKTSDEKAAKRIATEIINDVLSDQWERVNRWITPRKGKVATVGQVIEMAPADHAKSLLKIITAATGRKDPSSLPLSMLKGEVVTSWQAKAQGLPAADFINMHEVNGGLNATLRRAKAVFGAECLTRYQSAGLSLPDLSSFLDARPLPEDKFRYSDSPLSRKQIDHINAALPALAKSNAALHKQHLKLALEGVRSGKTEPHAAWLKQFGVTPEQVRWHVGAVWYRRTGSLNLAAEKMDVTRSWAVWHYGNLKVGKTELTLNDL